MSLLNRHRKKPYKTAEVGEWQFEWHYNEKDVKGCYLQIKAKSGAFSVRINGAYHPYGYLLAALEQGKTEQLLGFAALAYVTISSLTQEQDFVDDITKAVEKHLKRVDDKAQEAAAAVTEAQEQVDEILMRDIISEQSMSEAELEAKREEDKEILKEILAEQDNGEQESANH